MTGALVALSVVALALRGGHVSPVAPTALAVPLLAAAFAATEFWTLPIRRGDKTQSITITELPLALGLLLASPLAVVLGRLVGQAVTLHFLRRQAPERLLFNLALGTADIAAATTVLSLLSSDQTLLSSRGSVALLVAMIAVVITANVGVTAVISAVAGRLSLQLLRPAILAGLPTALAAGSLALVIAQVIVNDTWLVGPLGITLVIIVMGFRAHASLEEEHIGLERLSDFATTLTVDEATPEHVRALLDEAAELLEADLVEMSVDGDEPFQHVSGAVPTGGPDGRIVDALDWDGVTPTVYPAGRSGSRATDLNLRTNLRDALVVAFPPLTSVRGALVVANRSGQRNTFSAADLVIAESVANHLAIAFANARLALALRLRAMESEQRARHDDLTGLPNRSALLEHLRGQPTDAQFCVMLMDLDRFKQINDTMGHAAGDELLIAVTRRLRRAVGTGPLLTRLGGDEFAAIVPGDIAEGRTVAERIVAGLRAPFTVDGVELDIGVSVGLCQAPTHGTAAPDLLHHADLAMYRAKASGRGVEQFQAGDDAQAVRQLLLAADLPAAITQGQFTLNYQPVIGVGDGRLWTLDARAKWIHPTIGIVPAEEFIPIAERSGTIRELTLALLEQGLRACREWRLHGADVAVGLCLSPRVLVDQSIPAAIAGLLREAGLPGSALHLDVTEDAIAADPGRAVPVIRALADHGVSCAIQQFGTGFTSLALLPELRVDALKIAPSFMTERRGVRGEGVMRSILQLGRNLDMRVVAVGVDSDADLQWLMANGCDAVKGPVVAHPMPAAAATEFVSGWPVCGDIQPSVVHPGSRSTA